MALTIDRKKFGSLAKRDKLVPHLDALIGKGDFPWTFDYTPKEPDQAFHPSGDCTPSLLALYLKAKGEGQEPSLTPALYKTFLVGHFWHQYVQHLLVEKLEFAEPEAVERKGTYVWDDSASPAPFHYAIGSADVAPVTIPMHGDYLLDIKTMNSHDFRSTGLPKWTADKWECQVNMYMDWFGLTGAIILGVHKDSPHEFREYEFRYNQPLVETIYKKWKLVSACLREDVTPPLEEEVHLPLQGTV